VTSALPLEPFFDEEASNWYALDVNIAPAA
jgi:hypothetical protein